MVKGKGRPRIYLIGCDTEWRKINHNIQLLFPTWVMPSLDEKDIPAYIAGRIAKMNGMVKADVEFVQIIRGFNRYRAKLFGPTAQHDATIIFSCCDKNNYPINFDKSGQIKWEDK